MGGKEVDHNRIEELRDEIDTVLVNRQKVVEAGRNLITLWTLKEVRKALAVANPSEREEADPRVEHIIEEHLPKILPPSYMVGLTTKLSQAKEAAAAGDIDAARGWVNEIIEEAQRLRDDKITSESADELITVAKEARKAIEEEAAQQNA